MRQKARTPSVVRQHLLTFLPPMPHYWMTLRMVRPGEWDTEAVAVR
jgi:hypothetical protein